MDDKIMPKDEQMSTNDDGAKQIPPELLEMISGGSGNGPYLCKMCGRTIDSAYQYAKHISAHLQNIL